MRENARILHYEVGRRLGRGGMGEVYEGLDLDLGRRVALKFVAPELAADTEALRRFEREARSAAALSHPNIATLYAFERDGDTSFIAMELVAGGSVRDRVRAGPMPVAEALAVARDVAGALALAHRRGIVHRDVKPENLMFDEDGVIKLMDFGLARAAQASRMTMTGSTLGTAAYMPPESMHEGAGAPGDVFALGVTLHEMLTAGLPFGGETPLALLYSIANEPPRPLCAARPEAPLAVDDLVGRMLAKTPADRPDATAVARELAAITGSSPPAIAGDTEELSAVRVPADDGAESREALVQRPTAGRGALRRRWVVAWIALAATIAIAGLLLPPALRARGAARHQEATRMADEGVDSLAARNLLASQVLFESALKLDPDHGKAGVSLGLVLHRRGDDARAAEVLRRVLTRHGADRELSSMARDALAEIDMAGGNWGGAVESLRRAFALDSSGVRAYNQLAYALIRAGAPNEGIGLLTRAVGRFPGQAVLHKNLGLAALALGDPRGAIAEADRALTLDPAFAPALALRSRARTRLGDRAGARADWTRYLALHPSPSDSAETANELTQAGLIP